MAEAHPLLLLIEDNEYDVMIIQRAITKSRLACHLEVVRDGQDAIDFLFQTGKYENRLPAGDPALVLLDMRLPRVSGLNVLKALKYNIRTANIPIVILTMFPDDPSVREGYDLGANSFVWKSMDVAKYIEDIQMVIRYWILLNKQPDTDSVTDTGVEAQV